ncbi:hypothetical protein O181_042099 [Austropuccinia psidii MF-1]|uniref:Uncharacterized protein n=1 Tax=Austropuccinia psidii MF-1 TaxID=1389203 RepID=A0A9Q3DFF2_9BASI|nr:hypothetical protein [Austropuccinia psidii MF-1]
MSPVHLRNLGFPRNKPEDRQGLFRTRRTGYGHLGHHSGWQDTEGNHTHSSIDLPTKQKPQSRGLEGYGSSSSDPPNPQRFIPMKNGHKKVQPSITLGRAWSKFPEDISQRDILHRSYGNYQMMQYQQEVQTPGGEETRIRENQATSQAIEEQLNQTGPSLISSGSQGVKQQDSPVVSHH